MDITVIICTWNRCESLRRTLTQFAEVIAPEGCHWEILVVNNNCTDDTDSVVRSFSDRLPIRSVLEPQQGLSVARNRGVKETDAELLLWTDDDVLVGRQWLAEYWKAIVQFPNAAFFGGPIRPAFLGTPPKWLKEGWRTVQGAYAVREHGNEPFLIDERTLPYGANFAVRREVQQQFLYDTHLGRKASELLSGEEAKVMSDMLRAGHQGRWLPDAEVHHLIEADRQTLRYLRRYYYANGVLQRRLEEADNPVPPRLGRSIMGIPVWLIRKAVIAEARYRADRVFTNPSAWLTRLKDASLNRGMVAEAFRARTKTVSHGKAPPGRS